jgi:hypothetical protein
MNDNPAIQRESAVLKRPLAVQRSFSNILGDELGVTSKTNVSVG